MRRKHTDTRDPARHADHVVDTREVQAVPEATGQHQAQTGTCRDGQFGVPAPAD